MADAKGKDAPPKGKEAAVAKKREGGPVKGGDEKKRKLGKPRNYNLGNGVYRFSRSRMYQKKAIYKFIGKKTPKTVKPKKPTFIVKPIGGDKNGGTRKVLVKKRKNYYPTADRIRKRPSKKLFSQHRHKLRKSLTPGRVCIVLAGPHKGKRVVFLKQLRSGLLLVTGPFKVNACPLRRINQIYVIATSTSLDVSGVKVPDHINDDYFKRNRQKRAKKEEGDIFSTKKEAYKPSEQRKEDQVGVDKQILDVIRKHPEKKMMYAYLGSMFGLRSGKYPHKLKF
ncbi:60S ribosomal protein L6 [Ischnura elegans]|uniref:60S ribosomal protein L6 n=1 Tax=Ischnura elegans TaxID=197161 RepID=UPI001ED86F81|nr:60S ribosomal protein L6 [Ischnura elegans]XP_046386594.1 60S ribosomal protein L6 [Ischnura elegans]XP_046386595.1 60S ribosomal protein L6 [Ischnura elegans]